MATALAQLLDNQALLKEDGAKRIIEDDVYTALLQDLQSNILTPHGFDQAHYFGLKFDQDPAHILSTKYLLGMLARNGFERVMIRTAIDNHTAREAMSSGFKAVADQWLSGAPGQVTLAQHLQVKDLRVMSEHEVYFRRVEERKGADPAAQDMSQRFTVNVLLSASGYKKLGFGPLPSKAFSEGMTERGRLLLNDPPVKDWDADYRAGGYAQEIDALVIVAYDPEAAVPTGATTPQAALATFETVIEAHAKVVVKETARTLRVKKDGREYPIEPFGFRDNLSQPTFYQADADNQRKQGISGDSWKPFAPLRLALTPDPYGRTPLSCGTYFVFRKLEQDIAGFYGQTKALADSKRGSELGLTGAELRARFIGRDPSGQLVGGKRYGALNDFDFADDPKGQVCPFHAHVRKANPRAGMRADYAPREHRIVRRGLPYGPAIKREDGIPCDGPLQYERTADSGKPIGTLFLCAQSDIEQGFEYIQARWENKVDHPRGRNWGVDTVAGQALPTNPNAIALDLANPGELTKVKPVVTLRGGGYFFAPSISFLRGLLDDLLAKSA